MKWFLSLTLLGLLATLAGVAALWFQYQQFLKTPLDIENTGIVLVVDPGASIKSVLSELDSRGVTGSDWHWRLLNRLQPTTIKTGEYALESSLLPVGLLDLLASGKVIAMLLLLLL